MNADWLLAWWNLIYEVPFLLALLYLALYASSGLTFGEAEVGAEADLDADAGVDAEAEAGAEAGAEAETGAGAGAEAEADGGSHPTPASAGAHAAPDVPFYVRVMSVLGVGEVPLSIALMVLLFTWGTLGFIINNTLRPLVPFEWMVALLSIPAAGVGSLAITRVVVRWVARWFPTSETYVKKKADLVGGLGEAIFAIDGKFGMAAVLDPRGDLYQVTCRTYEDSSPIEKGKRVLLVDYDPREKFFYVKESNLAS